MEDKVVHIIDGKNDYYFDSRSLHDIVFIKACGNYIDITFTSTQNKGIRIQIGQFWKKLERLDIQHDLVRIDRSTIINLKRVVFINQKKGTITLRTGNNNVQEKIAHAAFGGLKEKIAKMMKESPYRGIQFINRHEYKDVISEGTNHEGHVAVDLDLPSGTLWASEDMSVTDSDFELYALPLYDSPLTILKSASENDDYVLEEDRATIEWGGAWRIPSTREWQELLGNTTPKWAVNKDGNIICVLMGKNGNHITLSSVSPHRGLCTYWSSSEEVKEQDKLEDGVTQKFFSVEINEPYEDEPWYHFVMDLNRPKCNLHAVISKDSII
jgi:hypothetical protein